MAGRRATSRRRVRPVAARRGPAGGNPCVVRQIVASDRILGGAPHQFAATARRGAGTSHPGGVHLNPGEPELGDVPLVGDDDVALACRDLLVVHLNDRLAEAWQSTTSASPRKPRSPFLPTIWRSFCTTCWEGVALLNTDAFDDRYEELLADLRRVCRAVGAGDEAEDVAQETLWYARARLSELRDDSRLVPWLRKIAVRHAWRAHGRPVEDLHSVLIAAPTIPVELAIDERRALVALPRREREVVMLVYIAGFREEEVASMLGVSRGTVAKTLWRARCSLSRSLSDYSRSAMPCG